MSQLTRGKDRRLMYVENKQDADGRGLARIGWVTFSKSGRSIYYRDLCLQRIKGGGVAGNYFDPATGDEYWVSGVKRGATNRHWAGGGEVVVDDDAKTEFEKLTGK